MARFDKMVPFILHWEVGLKKKYMNLEPKAAYAIASRNGYHNLPDDKGGPTMCGVTLNTYRSWCAKKGLPRPNVGKLKVLPYEQWEQILKSMFWDKCKADQITDEWVAMAIVDWSWISGTGILKRIQKIVGVTQDGIVGPNTLRAINSRDPRTLLSQIIAAREAHMRSIAAKNSTQKRYLNG